MKAVIVGVQGRYAAALTEDGRVTRVRNRGYAVGQTVEPDSLSAVSPLKRAAGWAAAAAAAIAVCSGGAYLYASPYAYVSLDVNPSVEYVLNRFDRVLRATAVNEDGNQILEGARLTNKPIDDAVRETLDRIASSGYFEETKPNGLVIAASCQDEKASEKLALRLEQRAQEETGSLNAKVEVAAVTVSQERYEEAKNLGVTPGKLDLVEQLKSSVEDPDSVDTQAWLSQPVVEIMNEIKASQEGQPQTSSGDSDVSFSDAESGESSTEEEPSQEPTLPESAEPSVDPITSEPESQSQEGQWESSLPEESSAESSDGSSELAVVEEPLGKPADKPKNHAKRKEGINGPVIPLAP